MSLSSYGFTKFGIDEFEDWMSRQTVARTITTIQHHHTWKPDYSSFSGRNHFELQRGMRDHHVRNNGWADIGQHFSIFPDGTVLTGRALNRAPACIFNANSGGICIENVGNFDKNQDIMTDAQEDAILRVTVALLKRFSMVPRNESGIVYHHWYDIYGNRRNGQDAIKSCPGTAFFGGNSVAAFRQHFMPGVLKHLKSHHATAVNQQLPGMVRFVRTTPISLNFRQGAGSKMPLVSKRQPAELGSVLRVWEEKDGWLRTSNTQQEWVNGRFTVPVHRAVVTVADSNIRDRPSKEGAIVKIMQPGTVVFIEKHDADWAQLDPYAWIHKSLIEADNRLAS